MPKDHDHIVEEKLDVIIELLKNLLALELSKNGVRQIEISKRLHVANSKVGEMLAGVKRAKYNYD